MHASEMRGKFEPIHERLDVADFLICDDNAICEIKHGQEKAVAENLGRLEENLTPEQTVMVLESLMGKKLLTDEAALESAKKLAPERKIVLIKYVLKVLRRGEYEQLVGAILSELYKREDALNELLLTSDWNDKTKSKTVSQAYDEHHELGRLFFDLIGFVAKEAPDRYADVALFDQYELTTPPRRGKTLTDYEVALPQSRLDKLINDRESAQSLARILAAHGTSIKSERAQGMFQYLFENFPSAIIPQLHILAQFDKDERPESELLLDVFNHAALVAERSAERELGGTDIIVKNTDSAKVREEKERMRAERKEKVEEFAARARDTHFAEILSALNQEEKELFTRVSLSRIGYLRNSSEVARSILRNLDIFRGVDRKLIEKRLLSKENYIGLLYFTDLDKEAFGFLKKFGYAQFVIDYGIKEDAGIFSKLIEDGDIELIGPDATAKIMRKLDNPDTYGRMLLKNPLLLSKYKCTPPREALKTFEMMSPESALNGARYFLKYAERVKNLELDEAYRLDEQEVRTTLEKLILLNIGAMLAVWDGQRKIKEILGETFFENTVRKYILEAEDLNLEGIFQYHGDYAEHFKEIIENNPQLKAKVAQALLNDPETIFDHYDSARIFFNSDAERREFIFTHIEYLRSDRANLEKIFNDICLEPAATKKVLEIIADKHRDILPKVLSAFLQAPGITEARLALVAEYTDLVIQDVRIKPKIVLDNLLTFLALRLRAVLDEQGLDLKDIVQKNFVEWCVLDSEGIWNHKNELLNFFGKQEFQRLIFENRFSLGEAILEDFYLRDTVYDAGSERIRKKHEKEDQEFLRKIGKEIVAQDPLKIYNDAGEVHSGVFELRIREPRKIFFDTVKSLPLAEFYSKKLRNLMTVSETLENDALDQELVEIGRRIARLSKSPALPIFLHVIDGMPRRQAEDFLAQADVLVSLNHDVAFAEKFTDEVDLKKLQEGVDAEIRKSFNVLFGFEVEQSKSKLLAHPQALLIFTKKFSADRDMMRLLKTMTDAELHGEFAEWKFFEEDADHKRALHMLQEKKFLPARLTFEQYKAWTETETVTTKADIKIDVSDVCSANKHVVRQALALGHVRLDDEDVFDLEKNIIALEELEIPLREIGDKLKTLATEETAPEEGRANLEARRAEYMQEFGKELIKRRALTYLGKLLTISGEEALLGQIKFSNEHKQGIPLDRIFRTLRDAFAEFPEFINDLGKIQATIAEIKKQKDVTVQKLTVTDETDFLIAMEIGAYPVASCQHYERGSYNSSLPAYAADPNTKIFIVKGEKGQLIARSIARLLADKYGQPVLYLESIYSANPSPEIEKLIIDFAYKKAQKLNSPLAANFTRKNFSFSSGIRLKNETSRNSYIYTDSGGGLRKGGKFVIPNAQVIMPKEV